MSSGGIEYAAGRNHVGSEGSGSGFAGNHTIEHPEFTLDKVQLLKEQCLQKGVLYSRVEELTSSNSTSILKSAYERAQFYAYKSIDKGQIPSINVLPICCVSMSMIHAILILYSRLSSRCVL